MIGQGRRENNPALNAEIGRRIRAARVKRKLKTKDLAVRIRMHPSMVAYVEKGAGGSLGTLYAIAEALGVTLHSLLPKREPRA